MACHEMLATRYKCVDVLWIIVVLALSRKIAWHPRLCANICCSRLSAAQTVRGAMYLELYARACWSLVSFAYLPYVVLRVPFSCIVSTRLHDMCVTRLVYL